MIENKINILVNRYNQGESIEVVRELELLIEKYSSEKRYILILIEMYFDKKEWKKVIELGLKLEKTREINNLIAIAHFKNNEKEKSKEIFINNIESNGCEKSKINLLSILTLERSVEEAEKIEQLIKISECDIDGLNTLGNFWKLKKKYEKALGFYNQCIDENHKYLPAIKNKADIYYINEMYGEAKNLYLQIEKIDKKYNGINELIIHCSMKLCDWDGLDHRIEKAIENKNCHPLLYLTLSDNPENELINTRNYIRERYGVFGLEVDQKFFIEKSKVNIIKEEKINKINKKINVAYISNDFKNHATSYLIAGLIQAHNKEKFNIYCIHLGSKEDEFMQNKIKENCTQFFIANNDKKEFLRIIEGIEIDIAVDLNFVTQENFMDVMINKIAKIQINFLGYPGTTGLNSYNYIIMDGYLINKNNSKYITENKIIIEGCYQPNYKEKFLKIKKTNRLENNLPEDKIVFGSFNATHKITPKIFKLWVQILNKVEGSILWILCDNFQVIYNLRKMLIEEKIDPQRIIAAKRLEISEHLGRIKNADLVLDTYPYGAHTTAGDVLSLNIPIVTLAGDSFQSRVCASILKTLGVEELIAYNEEEYVGMVIKLAENINYRNEIKNKIDEGIEKSGYLNPEKYAIKIEQAYESICNIYMENLNGQA